MYLLLNKVDNIETQGEPRKYPHYYTGTSSLNHQYQAGHAFMLCVPNSDPYIQTQQQK